MLIKSQIKTEDITLFDIDLNSAAVKEQLQTQEIKVEKNGVKINTTLTYSSEICIVQTSFQHNKDIIDIFNIDGEYIKIIYLLKGKNPTITDTADQLSHSSHPGFLKLGYGKDSRLNILMPKNEETEYTIIVFSYAYFKSLMKGDVWLLNSKFHQAIEANKPLIGEMNYYINFPLHHIVSEMVKYDWRLKERTHYLDLKLKEFLLTLYCYEQENELTYSDISSDTLNKIKRAHYYMEVNFRETPTIKELAREVMLNEAQLKKGFKKVYGSTIRSHIIDLKMKEALALLKTQKINEIAATLGYGSIPHFITSFKKYYGASPSQMKSRQ